MPLDPLLAVLANPRDDAARVAFAAAVAASDPGRAALVRTQLEIAQLRRQHAKEERWEALERKADRLAQAHGARWGKGLERFVPQGSPWESAWTWRRGFVEGVKMSPRAFLDHADALFRVAPILDLVATSADGLADLLDSPFVSRLRSLSCFNLKLGDAGARALLDTPFATHLAWLDLAHNRLSDATVEALAAAQNLPVLRYVRLSGNPCADPNPTFDEGEGIVFGTLGSPRARELVAKFGPIAWLGPWPSAEAPDPEAVG